MDSLMIQMSKRIDMEIAEVVPPYKNPMSYYCGIAGNEGATGLLLLVTSNIAIHAWNGEYPNRIQVDCYSCKDFDIEDVLLCFSAFKILSGTYILVDRDTKLKVIDEGEIGAGGVIQFVPGTVIRNRPDHPSATLTAQFSKDGKTSIF
jgi:S-adenosylmethionine/arginine decarboxylase-like enzyme